MKLIIALLLISVAAFSQGDPMPTPTPIAEIPIPTLKFPSQFVALGGQYTNVAPHYTAWLAIAKLMSQSAGTYSFSGMYLTMTPDHKLTTSATTGVAQYTRSVFGAHVYVIGGGGAAVSASIAAKGSSIGLALNGGILTVVPIERLCAGCSLDFLAQALNAGGSNNFVGGIGFGWGK